MENKCAACGFVNPEGAGFCSLCGVPFIGPTRGQAANVVRPPSRVKGESAEMDRETLARRLDEDTGNTRIQEELLRELQRMVPDKAEAEDDLDRMLSDYDGSVVAGTQKPGTPATPAAPQQKVAATAPPATPAQQRPPAPAPQKPPPLAQQRPPAPVPQKPAAPAPQKPPAPAPQKPAAPAPQPPPARAPSSAHQIPFRKQPQPPAPAPADPAKKKPGT